MMNMVTYQAAETVDEEYYEEGLLPEREIITQRCLHKLVEKCRKLVRFLLETLKEENVRN